MTLHPNDTVTIYSDPITQTDPEGQAKLLRKIIGKGGEVNDRGLFMEYWLVEFLPDQALVCRWIKTNKGGTAT